MASIFALFKITTVQFCSYYSQKRVVEVVVEVALCIFSSSAKSYFSDGCKSSIAGIATFYSICM